MTGRRGRKEGRLLLPNDCTAAPKEGLGVGLLEDEDRLRLFGNRGDAGLSSPNRNRSNSFILLFELLVNDE